MRVRRVLAVSVILLLAASAPVAGAGAAPARGGRPAAVGCAQPYQPWFTEQTYPATLPVPDLGPSIAYAARKPDTDGDGVPDTIITDTPATGLPYQRLTIKRGDGTVTLLPGTKHHYIYLSGYGPQLGDLDGDGRDELLVGVDQQGAQYLVPGTTAPGTHDIDQVGISTKGLSSVSRPVGDQDGDHKGDVAFPNPTGTTWSVYSGADLMAPGPGGTVGSLTPIETLTAGTLTSAVLTPGAAPTIITAVGSTPPGGGTNDLSVTVTVHRNPAVVLTASNLEAAYTSTVGGLDVYRHDGDLFVSHGSENRDGASIAIWDLTNPCARYVAASLGTPATPTTTTTPTGSGTAPAATPVDGAASFTG